MTAQFTSQTNGHCHLCIECYTSWTCTACPTGPGYTVTKTCSSYRFITSASSTSATHTQCIWPTDTVISLHVIPSFCPGFHKTKYGHFLCNSQVIEVYSPLHLPNSHLPTVWISTDQISSHCLHIAMCLPSLKRRSPEFAPLYHGVP